MTSPTLTSMMTCVSATALATILSTPALAQPAAPEPVMLETIVISGEYLPRSIFATASSVSAYSKEDIEERVEEATIKQVVEDVPNVFYPDNASAPFIRGQDTQGPNWGAGAFMGGTVPRARTNVDGHYLTYNELVFGASSLWDVSSVEVFRGPQTSYQGANSIAGAIVVKTNDPTFTPEGALRLQYGSNNKRRAALMYSAPITGDLAARIALDYSARDTFIDYVNPNFAQGETDQNFEVATGRLKLLWQPSQISGLEAKLTFAANKTNSPQSEAASGDFEDDKSMTLGMPSWEQKTRTAILDLSYDFGNGIRLSNQTQYSAIDTDRVSEPAAAGSATLEQTDLSNETRLTFGEDGDRISAVAGLFYSRFDSDEVLMARGESKFDDTKRGLGVYGEMTYRPADRWAVTAGVRYQRDEIERRGTSVFTRTALDYEEEFDAWLPRLSVAYDVSDHTTFGALVSKGYNPGGVSLSFSTGQWVTFDAETAWNYELFARSQLLNDRLLLTGNLFYTDFENSQRVLPDYLNGLPFGNVVVNADKATSYGLEVQADYQATDRLRLSGGVGLLETNIDELRSVAGISYEDNEFGRAPGFMVNLGLDWDITPKTTLSGSVRHTSDYYSTDVNNPDYRIGDYTIANARVSYRPQENTELFAYVDNIFDERAPSYKYDDRTAGGIVGSMISPREVGFGLNMSF